MTTKTSILRVSGAVLFRENRGKRQFLLIKDNQEEKWQIPKVTVRKGESSVRAAIRMMGEMAGINARVLEEAGRGSGVMSINGRSIPQKLYYYLMVQRAASEVIGFESYAWFEYEKAVKALSLKREKEMLKGGRDLLKKWEKEKKKY